MSRRILLTLLLDRLRLFRLRQTFPPFIKFIHFSGYRMIPLPTRKEIIRCKKRAKTQTSNPTLITTEQQVQKSRKPRRSGTRKEDPETKQERLKRSALSDIRSYLSKVGSKIEKDLKDLFSPEPKLYLELRNKRAVVINKTGNFIF